MNNQFTHPKERIRFAILTFSLLKDFVWQVGLAESLISKTFLPQIMLSTGD